jgi:hypothetical protein
MAVVSTRDVYTGVMSNLNVCTGPMSSREVSSRDVSSRDVGSCNVSTADVSTADVSTAAAAVTAAATAVSTTAATMSATLGRGIGGKRQAAERENCGQYQGWFARED